MTFAILLIIILGVLAWMLWPGRRPRSYSTPVILATVIPIALLAIAAVIFQLLHNTGGMAGVSDISNTIFVIGLGLIGAAILILAGSIIARRGEVARDIGFGLCIAVALCAMEFAVLEGLAGV